MYGEVAAQSGLDASDTTVTLPLLKRWLNIVQQDIAGRWTWNFLKSREAIATVADFTGTAAVTFGSANTTDSNFLITSAHVGRFIQFEGYNDWYAIASVSAPNFPVLATAYQGPTDSSIGYTVRKFFYSLSSSADRILDIRNFNTPLKLVEVDPFTLDDLRPNPQSTGGASAFIAYGYDSSGNIQISPYPFPNDTRLFEIRTLKRVSDLSATTDTTIIPTKWHHVMVFGANALAFAYTRKWDASQYWNAEYEKKIADMIKQQRTSEDTTPVLKAIDSNSRGGYVRLPDQYPAVGPGGF
jgi:hypothetical protein